MWRSYTRTQKLWTYAAATAVTTGTAVYIYHDKRHHRPPLLLPPRDKIVYAEAATQPSPTATTLLPTDKPLWKAPSREQLIQQSKQKEFDLLVVGGGATGTGTAVDAATRGLSVAMLERDDFASGIYLYLSILQYNNFYTSHRHFLPIHKIGPWWCTLLAKGDYRIRL